MLKFKRISFEYSEDELALVDSEDTVVLSGDYDHDKIDDRIEGFLYGIEYAGLTYEIEDVTHDGSLYDSKYYQ